MNDLIDRQAAISDFEWCKSQAIDKDRWQEAIDRIKALPSAEEESFEWCTDCKEYDPKAHCCHRWTKAIRNTVEEIKNEQRWIPCGEKAAEPNCLACDIFGQVFIALSIVTINGDCYDGTDFNFDVKDFLKGKKVQTISGDINVLPRKITAWMPLPEPYKKEGD